MEYTRFGLNAAQFQGFVPLKSLDRTDVLGPRGSADVEGVYVVLRSASETPVFIEDDHPKPRVPVPNTEAVANRWVEDSPEILYVGKAPLRKSKAGRRDGLAKRMLEFRKTGFYGGTNHFGGRLIWRIADRDSLLICWKCLPEGKAADIESLMVAGYRDSNRRQSPPFANIGRVKRDPDASLLCLLELKGC